METGKPIATFFQLFVAIAPSQLKKKKKKKKKRKRMNERKGE
jgi:hypothetical protein